MLFVLIVILILCLASSAVAFYFLIHDEKSNDRRKAELGSRIEQLERELSDKTNEGEGLCSRLKKEASVKEEGLNAEILALREQLAFTKDALIKEKAGKQAIENELQELRSESEKLKKDISLTSQMYEGLKAQYNELERLTAKPPKKNFIV